VKAELSDGFAVVEASDGTEALEIALKRVPDLVIADVMMPGIDGVELCRRLRSSPATAASPILLFSARGDVQTRLDAFAAGADDFVHKPFDPRELKARLAALLRRTKRAVGSAGVPPAAP
jgi:DNA-binding response OmpR family regulator